MRKTTQVLFGILIGLLVFILVRGVYRFNNIKPCEPKIVLQVVKEKQHVLDSYQEWLSKTIEYKADTEEGYASWADPAKTLSRGYGDCEDYAFLTQAMLEAIGYEVIVVGMWSKDRGHAVAVFFDKQYGYCVFDLDVLIKTKFYDPELFMNFMRNEYKEYPFHTEIKWGEIV